MKLASESMVRISVLGGDWNGHAVEGAPEVSALRAATSAAISLAEFDAVIRKATTARPYVHYDVETGCVMSVSEDNAQRDGFEVRRLSMPEPRVIEQWYAELIDASTK